MGFCTSSFDDMDAQKSDRAGSLIDLFKKNSTTQIQAINEWVHSHHQD